MALGETFARMRARGYSFITLDDAVTDPVYQRPDTFTGPGGSWLSRTETSMGRKIQAKPPQVPGWVSSN